MSPAEQGGEPRASAGGGESVRRGVMRSSMFASLEVTCRWASGLGEGLDRGCRRCYAYDGYDKCH
jgi:hypothetical protein